MSTTLEVVRVFLASPSDVPKERRIALDVQNRVNGPALNRGTLVHLMTWEQVLPGYGRPQDRINSMVDQCDLFVGLLHTKWGTRTGRSSSGFAEEFARAVKRCESSGSPEIALFFKRPSAAELASPGPELKKVLDFRQRNAQKVLYHDFRTTSDWERELLLLLTDVVTRPFAPSSTDGSERLLSELAEPWGTFELEEMKQALAGAINRLADRPKIVLTLYYYEGLTLTEIAEVLGVSENSVREIHSQAVVTMRRKLFG